MRGLKNTAFILLLILTGVAVFFLTKLEFRFEIKDFIPEKDEEIEYYLEFKDKFSYGNPAVIVGFQREEGIFDLDFLERVDAFADSAAALPHVTDVASLLSLRDPVYDSLFPFSEPAFSWRKPETYSAEKEKILSDPRFRDTYVSRDGKMISVIVSTEKDLPVPQNDTVIDGLYRILEQQKFGEASMAGYPVALSIVTKRSQGDFQFFIVISMILVILAISLIFRSVPGTLISLAGIGLSLVIFFGGLGAYGKPLTILSSLYPILLVIVGISDVVHLLTKYADESRRGKSNGEALKITFREVGWATLLTSGTTAIGFLSLTSSFLPPIREFGILAAIGVMLTFGIVLLICWRVLPKYPGSRLHRERKKELFSEARMRGLSAWTAKKQRLILITFALVSALCILGTTRISFQTYEDRNFPRGSRIGSDYDQLDEALNGIGSAEIALEAGEGVYADDLEFLRETDKLVQKLREEKAVGAVYSPLTVFFGANRALNANTPETWRLPDTEAEFRRVTRFVNRKFPDLVRSVISEDRKTAKISFNVKDIGSETVSELKKRLSDYAESELDGSKISIIHTGMRHVITSSRDRLVGSMLKSLGLAFLAVSFLMGLLFKNLRMVMISLIPNFFPLLVCAGAIGWLGIGLDAKVAMVFTIGFGIAVDDTIHFLARFRIERAKTKDLEEALATTFRESGKAILLTTMILLSGFLALAFSAFPPTSIIGSLLGLTLLMAIASDLFLLPALIRIFFR